MEDLQMSLTKLARLYSDSKLGISIVNNPVQHDRMKHVKFDQHFIQREVEDRGIRLIYIPTPDQEADIFTKSMARLGFETLINKLGMRDIYSLT